MVRFTPHFPGRVYCFRNDHPGKVSNFSENIHHCEGLVMNDSWLTKKHNVLFVCLGVLGPSTILMSAFVLYNWSNLLRHCDNFCWTFTNGKIIHSQESSWAWLECNLCNLCRLLGFYSMIMAGFCFMPFTWSIGQIEMNILCSFLAL